MVLDFIDYEILHLCHEADTVCWNVSAVKYLKCELLADDQILGRLYT